MLADVNKINYIQNEGNSNIIVEFSRLPIESFNTKEEAEEFILGYKTGLSQTEAMLLGSIFRKCVEADIADGVKYKKVNELVEVIS